MNDSSRFRPSLSLPEIKHLLDLCKRDASQESLAVAPRLSLYIAKIENQIISPAHTLAPPESLGVRLGIEEAEIIIKDDCSNAYAKWSANPASCSIAEIELSNQFRFENGLMSADEQMKYLKL